MYLDEQQYFIRVVLDISRKATAIKGRGIELILLVYVLSQSRPRAATQ